MGLTKVEKRGTIETKQGISKVVLLGIYTYNSMPFPDDYMFKYEESETNRPLDNSIALKSLYPSEDFDFNLPETLVEHVFVEETN